MHAVSWTPTWVDFGISAYIDVAFNLLVANHNKYQVVVRKLYLLKRRLLYRTDKCTKVGYLLVRQ